MKMALWYKAETSEFASVSVIRCKPEGNDVVNEVLFEGFFDNFVQMLVCQN